MKIMYQVQSNWNEHGWHPVCDWDGETTAYDEYDRAKSMYDYLVKRGSNRYRLVKLVTTEEVIEGV